MKLPSSLRCLLISDGQGDLARLRRICTAAIAGGIRAILLREPRLSARDLAGICGELRPLLAVAGGCLLVHDRADLCAAGLADGVHLAGHSLRPAQVRPFLPPDALIGCSVHDAAEIAAAAAADYLCLSRLHPSSCKPGAPALGLDAAAALIRGGGPPFLLLGGITPDRAAACRTIGAFGVAVMGAVCNAAEPRQVAAELCAALTRDGC